mmetsp:Transcript_31722/g.74097  ORF Transcript_31722/g.74097 Transcript_31722/m.74097 type:complete len:204 (-) Transcript_31722:201-812(-)
MSVRGRPLNFNINRENGYSDTSSSCNGKEDSATSMAALDKRMATMKQDFTSALTKISSKENEKFNLIFSILSELQQRQAQLEDSVRSLKTQGTGGQATSAPVVANQPDPAATGNEAMQSYAVMQDGTQAVFAPMVFVQQMPQPMVMQFVGQAPVNEDYSWSTDMQKPEQVMPVAAQMSPMSDHNTMSEVADMQPNEQGQAPEA